MLTLQVKRHSLYSTIFNVSILSKCFLFNVAKDKPWATAVEAMNKSARSICFRFLFKPLFIITAVLTDTVDSFSVFSNHFQLLFGRSRAL